MTVLEKVRSGLAHPKFPLLLGAFAFLSHAPSLGAGYLVDDHTHRFFAQGQNIPGGPRGPWDLYRFADGGAGVREAIDSGLHPWWTSPQLKLAFLRPIASLLRVAEEKVFAEHAFFPHLISVVLFVATVLVVHAAFKRWIGGAAAGLGALLFAIDDAHATTVTWIAARHSLLATFGAVLALWLFLRARDRKTMSVGAGIAFFCALLSSEAAASALAFFVAIALFDDPRPARERLRGLVPVTVATAVWLVVYRLLACGSTGSAYYVDPLKDPVRFVGMAVTRLPVLGLAQIFFPPSELSSMQPRLAPGLAGMGLVVLGLTFVLVWRTKERARALGLFVAFVVSLLPACGTNSDDRLLLLPGVAAMGLVALGCRAAWHGRPKLGARAMLALVAIVHVGFAVLLAPVRASLFAKTMATFVDRGARARRDEPGRPASYEHARVAQAREKARVSLGPPLGHGPCGRGVAHTRRRTHPRHSRHGRHDARSVRRSRACRSVPSRR
jgi:hypothetical protein